MRSSKENLSENIRRKRLGRQLDLSAQKLRRHPLVCDKLTVLHTLAQALQMQTLWKNADPLARLFYAFRFALHAQKIDESQTGFIGPALSEWQDQVAHVMHIANGAAEKEAFVLFKPLTQLIAIGATLLATYLKEKEKQIVPQEDPAAARRGAFLHQELGLIFLLGSKAPASAFRSFARGLGCREENQKKVASVGVCFLISMLLLIAMEDERCPEENLETLLAFLKPSLQEVELIVRQAQEKNILEEGLASVILLQMQNVRELACPLIKEALTKVFEILFLTCGLSYCEIKEDLKRLKPFCNVLLINFNVMINQTKMTASTMIQAA